MRATDAPLFVHAFDLARYLLERTARFPKNQRFVLAPRIQGAALDLVEEIAIALHEPEERPSRLRAADAALMRLRLAIRLARELELIRISQADHAAREIAAIGRMLGGWRRRERLSHAGPPG